MIKNLLITLILTPIFVFFILLVSLLITLAAVFYAPLKIYSGLVENDLRIRHNNLE